MKTLIIGIFCLSNMTTGLFAVSEKDIVKITMEGYAESKKGNQDKAHDLYLKALQGARKRDWPTYNESKRQKALQECIEKHGYDWKGTEEQKILGLMQVYGSVKNYFAGFGIVPELNWDELVIQYMPQVIDAKSEEEYYKLLRIVIARLSDNHTSIWPPKDLRDKRSQTKITIEFLENKFIVTKIEDIPEIREQNIRPGLEIRKVEGIPADKYFKEYVSPYLALSKVQRENFYRTSNLLDGEVNTKVKATMADLSGEEREVVLTRSPAMNDSKDQLPAIEVKELDSGIVYFNLRSFQPTDTADQKFEIEFNRLDLSKIKGMIFDVRENGGGNSVVGDVVISHLIDTPSNAWLFKARKSGLFKVNPFILAKAYIWLTSMNNEWYEVKHTIKPSKGKHFTGPVVVLISRYTGSAAEDFTAAIKECKRATIIGETTSGGTGNGLWSILPGYGLLRVCVNIGAYVNSRIWQGVGIKPDIAVSKTVEDVYNEHDPVLAKGIEVLNQQMTKDIK